MARGIARTIPNIQPIQIALEATGRSDEGGSTHNFYHYPARFSPQIAKSVIEAFSEPTDWVLDPFMGGGTSVIEGLALGRRMIGVDLNALAHFVADVRTRPLSKADEQEITEWAFLCSELPHVAFDSNEQTIANLPATVASFSADAIETLGALRWPRQRAFARCALLRLGQWALDCRDFAAPSRRTLSAKLPRFVEEMFKGLREFVTQCKSAGVSKKVITSNRILYCGNATGIANDPIFSINGLKPRLVFTSPPYPRVHVLYHRWQYRGRRETAAPYWIANVPDGYFASHYTGGSRTETGENHYFQMITEAFTSVRAVLDGDGIVAQLVGFANTGTQLPRYLNAMEKAGFQEWLPPGQQRLGRVVPNRKWYTALRGPNDASSETLLIHRPA